MKNKVKTAIHTLCVEQMTKSESPVPSKAMLGVVTLLLSLICAEAATVTLQHGVTPRVGGGVYEGTADSWLDETDKDQNYGASHELRIKYDMNDEGFAEDHTIIKFELPSLSFSSVNRATLELFYFEAESFLSDNALGIKPYRIDPTKWWFENNGGPSGKDGEGVNFGYRDQNQTLEWTLQYGGWYDKIDDGNGTNLIKGPGGSVPGAIEPGNWVPFNVQPSVSQWYGGATNNGFLLFSSYFTGSGTVCWGKFGSRDTNNTAYRPKLTIGYQGASISWAGAVNANWDTNTANWNIGGYLGTFGTGDFVTFADGAANPTISVAGAGVSPASVTISNSVTAYSFSGGGIGGSGTLTKAGSGTATLSAANSYSGQTLVQGGTLVVSANNALGTAAAGTVISNGAALGFSGGVSYSTTEPLTVAGAGVGGSGVLYAVSGNNSFAGPITLAADSTVGVGSGLGLTLGGTISGGYNLAKSGAGTLTLAAVNNYSGHTLVQAGRLIVAANNSLGTIAAGTVVSNGAALGVQANYSAAEPLTLSGSGISGSGALYAVSGSNIFGGPVTLAADSAIGVDTGLGLVLNNAISGNFNLIKSGAGTLAFTGATPNTFGGAMYVNQGTLALAKSGGGIAVPGNLFIGGANAAEVRLDADGQLTGGCNVTVGTSGLLNLNNFNTSIGSLTLSNGSVATGTGLLTLSGGINSLGNQTATISGNLNLSGMNQTVFVTDGTADDDLSLTANVVNGGISKTGAGRLVLSGDNSYDGETVVGAGVLTVTTATALGSTAGGTGVSPGARLELRSGIAGLLVISGEALELNGTGGGLGALRNVAGNNAWTGPVTLGSAATVQCDFGSTLGLGGSVSGNGHALTINALGDVAVNNQITGSGTSLFKLGAGTLTLSGSLANSYGGTTYVSDGTLLLAKPAGTVAVPGDLVIEGPLMTLATVRLLDNDQLASNAAVTVGQQGVLDLNNFSARIGNLLLSGGSVTSGKGTLGLGGNITAIGNQMSSIAGYVDLLGGARTINVDNGAAPEDLRISAVISNGAVLKNGTGTLVLLGANTYAGSTTVSEGTLALNGTVASGTVNLTGGTLTLGASERLADAAALNINGGIFDMGVYNETVGTLTLAQGIISGTGTLSAANDFDVRDGLVSATLAGRVGLVKTGTGTVTLTGRNTYHGPTTISEGVLALAGRGSIDFTPSISVGSGAIFDVSGVLAEWFLLGQRQTLKGNGTVHGRIRVEGTLEPGIPIGTLKFNNDVMLADNSTLRLEVTDTPSAIDALDLQQAGRLTIQPMAQLELMGALDSSRQYVFVRRAQAVEGEFGGLPNGGEVPGQPGWYIHYGTHRIYFSQLQSTQPLAYFRAFTTNGTVMVAWRTLEEVECEGFDLFRRPTNSLDWVKVNQDRIPPQNPAGAIYMLVDSTGQSNVTYIYRLVEYASGGEEAREFERTPTEFAFSAPPKVGTNIVELRWWSRTDETYDLEWTDDIGQRLVPVLRDVPATPPECIVAHPTTNSHGFYRVRMVP